jgi:hypothetical protein
MLRARPIPPRARKESDGQDLEIRLYVTGLHSKHVAVRLVQWVRTHTVTPQHADPPCKRTTLTTGQTLRSRPLAGPDSTHNVAYCCREWPGQQGATPTAMRELSITAKHVQGHCAYVRPCSGPDAARCAPPLLLPPALQGQHATQGLPRHTPGTPTPVTSTSAPALQTAGHRSPGASVAPLRAPLASWRHPLTKQ